MFDRNPATPKFLSGKRRTASAGGHADERRRVFLSIEPVRLLELLAGFKRLELVTGNPAVRVEQAASIASIRNDGTVAILDDGAELRVFPERCRATTVEIGGGLAGPTFDFQLLLDAETAVLDVRVEPSGVKGARVLLDAVNRWQLPETPRIEPRPKVPRARTAPGLDAAFGGVRSGGDARTFHELIARHGLGRMDALIALGKPWAERLRTIEPEILMSQVAARRFSVQIVVGNEGVSYRRTGALAGAPCTQRRYIARAGRMTMTLHSSKLNTLWTVRLQDEGRTISSLEGYGLDGEPAFLLFGARAGEGGNSPAWHAFFEGLRPPPKRTQRAGGAVAPRDDAG